MASELDEFDDDFMLKDYLKSLNSSYFGGPGFALPDPRGGSKEPINILVDNIPSGLNREGLIRAFKLSHVLPINCKIFKTNSDRQKAILQVKTTTEATTAIQAWHLKEPLNLKITLAASKGEFERKKEEILREQRQELTRHLSGLIKPSNAMGDLVNNLLAVENLVKILPSPGANCSACEAEPLVKHVHFIAADETVFDPFEGLPATVPVSCAYCSNNEGKFVVCSGCFVAAYCGLRCQVFAWAHHRKVCSPPKKLTNGTSDKKLEKIPENVQEKVTEKFKSEEVMKRVEPQQKIEAPVEKVKKTEEIILNTKPSEEKDNRSRINVNTGFSIEQPARIMNPKIKISLNNEITFLRETKFSFGETVEIVASFIESPSEFYVQRTKDEAALQGITDTLIKSCDGSDEWPGAEKIKPGHYCAAMISEEWYRVKILQNDGSGVIVELVDFGNSDIISYTQLRPLPPMLATTPALACCCSLKYIKPLYESEWPREACKFIEDMFYEDNTTYRFCKVFSEIEGVYQVELYCEKGVAFSDLLVQKGYAKRYEEIRKPLNRNMMIRRNHPQVESSSMSQKSSDSTENGTVRVFESKNKYENEIQKYVPKSHRSIDRNEIKIENDRRINDTVPESRYPKPNHPIEPVSPPRPPPKKIVSPTEAYELSRKVCPANFYHLYNMTPFKDTEPVILYMDPGDSTIVYALGDNETMLELYEGLTRFKGSSPKIRPSPGVLGLAKIDENDHYRVLVLEMLDGGEKCRCFFLDYGNQDEIDSSQIYQIPSSIGIEKYPAQAVRCRVSNMEKISDYLEKLDKVIAEGTPVPATITRTISQHEYGIQLAL